jgi:hypothetical protein
MTDKGFEGPDQPLPTLRPHLTEDRFIAKDYPVLGSTLAKPRTDAVIQHRDPRICEECEADIGISYHREGCSRSPSDESPEDNHDSNFITHTELVNTWKNPEYQRSLLEVPEDRRQLAGRRMNALARKLAEDSTGFFELLDRLHIPYSSDVTADGKKAILITLEDIAESEMKRRK